MIDVDDPPAWTLEGERRLTYLMFALTMIMLSLFGVVVAAVPDYGFPGLTMSITALILIAIVAPRGIHE